MSTPEQKRQKRLVDKFLASDGIEVIKLQVPIFQWSDVLVKHGFLPAHKADDKVEIALATENVLSLMIAMEENDPG